MSAETKPPHKLSNKEEEADVDRALTAEAQRGNIDAFERLVARHQDRMVNIAVRLLGDHDEACECVQDAFVAAYRNLGGFRGESRFSTWLTSITLNHARNRLKRIRAQSGRIGFSLNEENEDDDRGIRRDLPSGNPSPLDRIEDRARKDAVRSCIDALELEHREVMVLRDIEDHSYEEISAMLGISAGTVKSRLFRARAAVRDCLKKAWGCL